MALSFFNGIRGGSGSKNSNNNNKNKNNKKNQSSGNSSSTAHPAPSAPVEIPVAVPVAYIPPLPSSSPSAYAPMEELQQLQLQQQRQFVPSYATTSHAPISTYTPSHNTNAAHAMTVARPAPTPNRAAAAAAAAAAAPLISNDEVKYNLQLLQHHTFAGRPLLYKIFRIVSILTCLTAINCIVAHALGLTFYGNNRVNEIVLRCFTIGLLVLVILIETNQTALVKESLVFQHWASRGIFYIFLGVLGVVEHDVGHMNYGNGSYTNAYRSYGNVGPYIVIRIPTGEGVGEFYIWLTSTMLIGHGILYLLLGTFCLHHRMKQMQDEYNERGGGGKYKSAVVVV